MDFTGNSHPLDSTFDAGVPQPPPVASSAAAAAQPHKSISTDDFEHILGDKIDTLTSAAAANGAVAVAAVSTAATHRVDDLLASDGLAAATGTGAGGGAGGGGVADTFGLFEHKKAATIDFMAAERQQQPLPMQHQMEYENQKQRQQTTIVTDVDDDIDGDDDDLIPAVPLKTSIYDDFDRQERYTAPQAPAVPEKFSSSDDLLGDFDDAADVVVEPIAVKPVATAVAAAVQEEHQKRQQTPDHFDEAETHDDDDDDAGFSDSPVHQHRGAAVEEVIAVAQPEKPSAISKPAAFVDDIVAAAATAAAAAAAAAPPPVFHEEQKKPQPTQRGSVSAAEPVKVEKKTRILADEIFCKIGLGKSCGYSHQLFIIWHGICIGFVPVFHILFIIYLSIFLYI